MSRSLVEMLRNAKNKNDVRSPGRRARRGATVRIACVAILGVAVAVPQLDAAPKKPFELSKVGFKLESMVDGDIAGFGIAVGDFDGDGIEDLAVGAACDDTNGLGAGATYILYGPITPGKTLDDADAIILGTGPGDYFGEFLTALDINGDGASELVVGLPGPVIGLGPVVDQCFMDLFQPGLNRIGEAAVFNGGKRLSGVVTANEVASTMITGLAPADYAGYHVGGADLNGDGRDELVVGAVGFGGLTGAGYLFKGGKLPKKRSALFADAQLVGEQPLDMFARNIVGGDIDGDGIDDLIITAPSLDDGRPGHTYVFFGGKIPSGVVAASTANLRLQGFAGDGAGESVTIADLNGDGMDDLVIGAPWANMTYVFYGPVVGGGTLSLADADVRVYGGVLRNAGLSVAVANLSGKGRSHLFIGAPRDGTGGDRAGAVHRLNKRLSGDIDATDEGFVYIGEEGEQVGMALAVGDLTGDGIDDLIVGAPAFNLAAAGHGPPGAVYVIPGG